MSCRDDLLELHHDGELDPPEALELDAHLTGCPRCREELEHLKRLRATLAAVTPPPADPAWVEAMVRAVPPPPVPRPASGPEAPRRWLTRLFTARISVPAPVLAAMLLLAALGWRRDPGPRSPVEATASVAPQAPSAAPRGPEATVDLAWSAPVESWPDLDQLSRDPTTRPYFDEWPGGFAPAARPQTGSAPHGPASRVVEEFEILTPVP